MSVVEAQGVRVTEKFMRLCSDIAPQALKLLEMYTNELKRFSKTYCYTHSQLKK